MVASKFRPISFIVILILSIIFIAGQPDATPQVASAQFRTPTFTPTPISVGPSPTPTATLLPPPANSGRIAVDELAIRSGPAEDFPVIGRLVFGDIIIPIAIDVGGVWIALELETGQIGWVASNLVEWDPELKFDALPLLEPTLIPDGFFLTGTPASTGATQTPIPTITSVPTATPTANAESVPTIAPIEQAEETDESEAVIAEVAPSATTISAEPEATVPPTAPQGETFDPRILTYVGLGIGSIALAVFSVLYSQRRASGRRELTRYAEGFPIENCPICRAGDLQLDEKINGALGIPNITRSVRCNNCRSLLREIEPGVWRYNIDPYVNPQIAYKYNTQRFTDADLLMLVREAQQYEPIVEQTVEGNPDRAKDAEDIVDLLPEIEPLISEIEKAQEEDRRKLLGENTSAEQATGDDEHVENDEV